jgi:hypothetical protein
MIGSLLDETLDEQRSRLVRQGAELRLEPGQGFAARQPFVRVRLARGQAPGVGLGMDVDGPVVERGGAPAGAMVVDGEVAQHEQVERSNLPERLLLSRDEFEHSNGGLGNEVLGTLAAAATEHQRTRKQ